MKKLFSILAAALVATATITPAQAELSQDGKVAVEYFNTLETYMNNMTAVLEKVTDQASADAQAEPFAAAVQVFTAHIASAESRANELTGMPNADDEAAFEQCQNNLHAAGMALQAELQRLAMVNFYDSEAFIKVLTTLNQPAEWQ
jgi:hypothetical protein